MPYSIKNLLKSICSIYLLGFNSAMLHSQQCNVPIKINKVSCERLYWKSYRNKKLSNTDTISIYFDIYGNDTLSVTRLGQTSYLNYYDTLERLVKRITVFDRKEKRDSSVYSYHTDGSYEKYIFYFDTTYKPFIEYYNKKGLLYKTAFLSGHISSQSDYDSLCRKIRTTIYQPNGKSFIFKENQTLDRNGRLHIDNKLSRGGSYDVYEYYNNGLLKRLLVYFDKSRTRWFEYISEWHYYDD